MKLLGVQLIGRLGNELFIYAHARAYAEQNGYELCMPPWIGEKIFEIPEAIRPGPEPVHMMLPEATYQHQKDLIYTRKQVREWFRLKPEILAALKGCESLVPVVLNVRRGLDYRRAGLVTLDPACYIAAADKLGLPKERIFETDLNPLWLPQFQGDIMACGLGVTAVALPSFYRLMTAPILVRANSTFSWWAATLGNGKVYSPIIKGIRGGEENAWCDTFVEGNWPVMADAPENSDLHLL